MRSRNLSERRGDKVTTALLCDCPFLDHGNAPRSTLLINGIPAQRRPNYRNFHRLLIPAVEYFLRSGPDYPLRIPLRERRGIYAQLSRLARKREESFENRGSLQRRRMKLFKRPAELRKRLLWDQ